MNGGFGLLLDGTEVNIFIYLTFIHIGENFITLSLKLNNLECAVLEVSS